MPPRRKPKQNRSDYVEHFTPARIVRARRWAEERTARLLLNIEQMHERALGMRPICALTYLEEKSGTEEDKFLARQLRAAMSEYGNSMVALSKTTDRDFGPFPEEK
jgi:hypothetical protein